MKKNIASSVENCSVLLVGHFNVEYSTTKDGGYSRFVRFSLHRPLPVSDFISCIRRKLLGSPSWVRSHVPSEFRHWSACFWFRLPTPVGRLYFPLEISSSDLNSRYSSREAAL